MNKSYLENITSRLKAVQRKENYKQSYKGIALFAILLIAAIILFSLFEAVGFFSASVRSTIFVTIWLIGIALFFSLVIRPILQCTKWFSNFDIYKTSKFIGEKFPNLKDDLLNAIQLIQHNDSNVKYSSSLTEAAFEEVYNRSKDLDFCTAVSFTSLKRCYSLLSGAIIVAAILFFVFTPINNAFFRIVNFDKEFIKPLKFTFQIYPGDASLSKGDSLEIDINVKGEIPRQITLYTKTKEESEFTEQILTIDSTKAFKSKIFNLKNSFEYYAGAEGIESDRYMITVINPPIINTFSLSIKNPPYSGIEEIVQKDNGNITALPGTKVNLNFTASKDIKTAKVIFKNRNDIDLSFTKNNGGGSFSIYNDDIYSIRITDEMGNGNINPIDYTISTLEDQYPLIDVIAPEQNITVTGSEQLPVQLKIKDDYGFSKLQLHYRLSESTFDIPSDVFKVIEIPIRKKIIEDEIFYVWNLPDLYLAVEDVISYYFEIFDNDNIGGPKSTKTAIYKLRVPSAEEIYSQADETNAQSEQELSEVLKEAEDLKEELADLSDKMKRKEKDITWEEKEAIENSLEKFKNLQEKIEDVQSQLSEMKKDLEENNLLSEETMRKYQELQDLMDELSSDEMKEAMQKMQDQLQKMNRNQVQQSMENFKMDEEAFQKSIERTMNLFKRIQIEQKMDEITKRIEKISEDLEKLNQETESSDLSDKEQNENLQAKQEQIKKDSGKLEEEMKNLQKKMSEVNNMPEEEMQKMMDELTKQNNEQLSDQIKEQMQQQQKMNAMQQQQQMSSNMQQNMSNMQQMMDQMMQQNQMQTMSQMMQLTNEMIKLSKDQENLKKEVEQLSSNSEEMREKAREQNEIQNNLSALMQKMVKLSQETFAITPEMGRELGSASREMQEALSAMAENQKYLSSTKQLGAMEHLNGAASLMKGSMQSMMNAQQQGAGGMMSLFQQMQQMSQQQMGLNQMTQMLNQGSLSPEQQGQLQRLAQQQRLIQKSMAQLNKEAKESGQSKKLAANLDKIMQDMKEVITGMETEKINDDLVQMQEKILSKMLDAQRSINERDFEKKRESITGKNIQRESPPELILSTEEGKNQLRDELMNSVKEGYSKDYQELIRKYFEALEKKEAQN